MDDLERNVLNLAAKLDAIAPEIRAALELRIDQAVVKKELELFRKEFEALQASVQGRLNDGADQFQDLKSRLQSLETAVKGMTEAKQGGYKKIWDLVKIVLTAAATAALTAALT